MGATTVKGRGVKVNKDGVLEDGVLVEVLPIGYCNACGLV